MTFLKKTVVIIILFCSLQAIQLSAGKSSKKNKELEAMRQDMQELKNMFQTSMMVKTIAAPAQPLSQTLQKQEQSNKPAPISEPLLNQIVQTPPSQERNKNTQKTVTSKQPTIIDMPPKKNPQTIQPTTTIKKSEEKKEEKNQEEVLNFEVKNETGKIIYVCCFYYMKRQDFNRWKWDKTDVQKVEINQTVIINPDPISNSTDRKNTYGYLAIFDSEQEAEDSSYELAHDKNKLDIDLLYKLKNKVIKLKAEKYGFKEEKLTSEFISKQQQNNEKETPKLDFFVENKAGRAFYLTSFIYEKKPNMPIWQYSKGPIVRIESNETIQIPVVEVKTEYERIYTRGYLGVFREDEKEMAEDITFEFLKPSQKMSLGLLDTLKNKKVVLSVEKYGINGDFIDFVTKPIQSPLQNRRS